MGRVIHFELGAQDPERAAEFYRRVFQWEVKSWGGGPKPYWTVTTGPDGETGINGGIMVYPDQAPRCVNVIAVDDLDAAVQAVEEAGGHVEVRRMAIPGLGYNAYFKDPEGNIVGLHQRDPGAA